MMPSPAVRISHPCGLLQESDFAARRFGRSRKRTSSTLNPLAQGAHHEATAAVVLPFLPAVDLDQSLLHPVPGRFGRQTR
jgi:hypothetical protein